jgi:Tol biopolymer transport system component
MMERGNQELRMSEFDNETQRSSRLLSWPVTAFLIFLGAAAPLTAAPPAGLSVDELTHTRSFALFTSIGSLSADGRWLAYAVRSCSPTAGKATPSMHGASGMRANNEGCSDLWVVDTKTGETQRVSDGRGNAEDAAWSPDGTELAYYAAPDGTAGLWIWDRATKKSHRAGKAIVRPSYSFYTARPQWMPDGKHVVALVLSEGTTVEQANAWIHAAPTAASEKDATIFSGSAKTRASSGTPLPPTGSGSRIRT